MAPIRKEEGRRHNAPASELAASVFRLRNDRNLQAPRFEFDCIEQETGIVWRVTLGGSRAYAVRYGRGMASSSPEAVATQAADSRFMIDRAVAALLLGDAACFTRRWSDDSWGSRRGTSRSGPRN